MADKKDPWKESVFTPYAVVPASKPRNMFEALPKYAKMKGKDLLNTITSTYNTIDKVYKGEISPDSPEAIEAALTATMMIGGTGMSTSGAVGGPGTTGMFIGKRADNFNTKAVELATKMRNEGKTPQQILEATGVRRWKSGDKQEISDRDASFLESYQNLPFTNTPLDKAIKHPELFKSYPKLKNTTINTDERLARGEAGYDPNLNTIYVSKQDLAIGEISPMLHEIQHWIQNYEGWPRGGSDKQFSAKVLDTTTRSPNAKLSRPFLAPWEQYERLIGETEARATQLRQLLTDQERRNILPEKHFTYMDSDKNIPLKDLNTEDYFNSLEDYNMSASIRIPK